ncbi:MAG: hypothetical protein MP439_10810 [Ferrimicrobium sp.]|jgi:hypothetical protein|nr:hypothetical protein [Ferrimicrobium sp.]
MTTTHISNDDLAAAIAELPLVDHHCHSFFAEPLTDQQVEDNLTESPDARAARTSTFDSNLGLGTLRFVGTALFGLEAPVTREAYLEARRSFTPSELVTRSLMTAGVSDLLVDTGYHADDLLSMAQLASLTEARVHEILRIETTAEALINELQSPEEFLNAWPNLLARLDPRVVGLKSIAAYRSGLALSGESASRSEVAFALGHELRHHPTRISDPMVIGYLVRSAIDITHLPVQFHIGLGDPDVRLATGRPGHLQSLIEFANQHNTAITLLHCYPYHREAALLAHDYPNVYLDLGLALNFVGPRATEVLTETLELAPYAKVLYSSDAYGLPELNYLGAIQFRTALTQHLTQLVDQRYLSTSAAFRMAALMSHETAKDLYQLS